MFPGSTFGITGASAPIFSTIIEKLGSLGVKTLMFESALPRSEPKDSEFWEEVVCDASNFWPRKLSAVCETKAVPIGQKVKRMEITEPMAIKLPIVRTRRIFLSILASMLVNFKF